MTEVPDDRLLEVLAGWTAGEGPLYGRLADALRRAVEDGRLAGGTELPPERRLAELLSVSRSTVVSAFERLKDDGVVAARQGSGTWVRRQVRPPDEGRIELVEQLEGHAIVRDLAGAPDGTIGFTAAAVDRAPEVLTTLTELDEATLRRWTTGHGYLPLGLPPLREAVATRLTATGLPTDPEQVLVTTGATEAILLAARLFAEPGDPVAVEAPSYPGAIDVLHAAGGRLLTVDVDHNGVRVDHLADLLGRSLPRLVYLVPDFHNPTGVVLTERRRREVARLAAEYHVPIVEDIVQTDLWFDGPTPAPIASHDPAAPILTVGSMSKVFWGGLRIGWVRANETTIARLGRMKAVTDFGTPVFDQLLAAQLIPRTDEVAAWRREELRERRDVLAAALARHLPDWSWLEPPGGLCLWVALPDDRAARLGRVATDHGVAIVPGHAFGPGDQRHPSRIRLTFVAPPAVIEEGVRRLAGAWNDLAEGASRTPQQALVV